MRFKHITAYFLMLAMLISYTVYGQNNLENETDKSSQVLLSMRIIDEVQSLQKEVTRGEFAGLMADIFGVTWDNSHAVPSFMDVNENHKYYGDICWLLDRKAISEGNLFEPNRSILMSEAAKIMVSLLGYDFFAKEQGGYPSGYMVQASDKGLLKDINYENSKPLTYSDAYKMMVSMLESEPYVDPDDRVKGEKYESTLMYYIFNARKIEGIVTSDGITAIKNSKVCIENCISIDDSVFEITDTVIWGDYIGYNVEAYVYNEDDTDKICYITPVDNAEIEILSADIYDISNGTVEYDANGKSRKIKLNSSIEFIYNNVCESFDSYADIIPTQGRTKFIDNDDDGKYDIIKTYQYKDMVLTYVDVQNKKLYDNKKGIEINLDSDDIKYTIIKNEEKIDVDKLSKDEVLTYYESLNGDIKQFYVSDNIIEGTVKGFREQNGKNILTINEKEYVVAEDCNFVPEVGYKGEFKLNIYNDIVYVGYMFGEGKNFGYVFNAYFDDLEEKFTIKMYTSNGFIESLECADKVILDGVRITDMNLIRTALCCDSDGVNNGSIVYQPIRYEINAKDKITLIDSLQSKNGGEDDVLSFYKRGGFVYQGNGIFGTAFGFDSDTVMFFVPDDKNEESFKLINSGSFSVDRTYVLKAYNLSETNIAELILVEKQNIISSSTMFVEKVYSAYVDEEVMTAISGYVNGSFFTYYVYPETISDAIERGDVIKLNSDHKLREAPVIIYDYSEDVASGSEIIKGTVVSISEDKILLQTDVGDKYLYSLAGARGIFKYGQDFRTLEKTHYSTIQEGDKAIVNIIDSQVRQVMIMK